MPESRYEREILTPIRKLMTAGEIEEAVSLSRRLGRAPFLPLSSRPKEVAKLPE